MTRMPYVFRQTDLPKLDIQVDRGSDFEAWKTQWTSYSTLSGLSNASAETKVQVLILCLSRETLAVVNNLGLTEEQKQDADAIITVIKHHIDGQLNESVERHNLRRRTQQPGESFDDFLVTLHELAKTYNYCLDQCSQKNIRDQIIEGTPDGDTIEQLFKQSDLTLEAAITICRAQEAAKKQRREMCDNIPGAILAVRQQGRQPPTTQINQHPATCPGCGSKLHIGGRARCLAYEQTCHHCNKMGHFSMVCRARQVYTRPPQPPGPQTPSTLSTSSLQMAQIDDTQLSQLSTIRQVTATEPAPTVSIRISSTNGSCETQALPDSGANISAAGPQLLHSLSEHALNLLPSKITPHTTNGHKM